MQVLPRQRLSWLRAFPSARAGQDRRFWTAALAMVIWLSFALRLFGLDRLPLWWDEGLSVFFARQDLSGLIRETLITSDANPPVYRLALSAWYTIAGSSPFATRLLLVMVGVLTVALTWSVGRWLVGRNAATLAALFLAVAPLQIYYAREAKGYAFAAACALISTYAWGRKLGYADPAEAHADRIQWWAIYVLSTVAAIGTHYYLGLVVLWQGLWVGGNVGLTLVRKRGERNRALVQLVKWGIAAALVVLMLTPWVLLVFRTTVGQVKGVSQGSSLDLWSYLVRVAVEFSAGQSVEGAVAWLAGCLLVLLVSFGTVAGGIQLFLMTWLAVPLAAAFPIQSNYSFFSPRFLLFLGPVCYLLVGRGVIAIGQKVSRAAIVVLVATMVVLCIPGLARIYGSSIDDAEDARPAMDRIRAMAQPGDAVLTTYIWQDGYLDSYVPDVRLTMYRSSYNAQTASKMLESIFSKHKRLWVYNYQADVHDRFNPLNTWLNRNAALAFDAWYGNSQVALFVRTDAPPVTWPARTTFERGIEMSYTPVDTFVRPGEVLALDLRWQSAGPLDRAYKMFVHLRRPDNPPVAQSDSEPAGGFEPTDAWKPGRIVLDRRALLVPSAVPPGKYTVYVGVYDPDSQLRLRVASPSGCDTADSACLGQIQIVPR